MVLVKTVRRAKPPQGVEESPEQGIEQSDRGFCIVYSRILEQ